MNEQNIKMKRRTVLRLTKEDYEFLARVANNDGDTKSQSMRRLVRALRLGNVSSFMGLDIRDRGPHSVNVVKIKRAV